MATPLSPLTREDLIRLAHEHYYTHRQRFSGPTEAVQELWPTLRRRIPAALRDQLALDRLADEIGRLARGGIKPTGAAGNGQGTVTIIVHTRNEPARLVQVPVNQVPQKPQILVPRILLHTTYRTHTVAKALIEFTQPDFVYCLAEFTAQQDGIGRHIDGMQAGLTLLEAHKVSRVMDLPEPALKQLAAAWQDVLRPPKAGAA